MPRTPGASFSSILDQNRPSGVENPDFPVFSYRSGPVYFPYLGDPLFSPRIIRHPPRKFQPQNSINSTFVFNLNSLVAGFFRIMSIKVGLPQSQLHLRWEAPKQNISSKYGICYFLEIWKPTWRAISPRIAYISENLSCPKGPYGP